MIRVERVNDEAALKEVFKIRQTVFVEEQEVDAAEEYDEFEDSSNHYLAFFNGIPAGTARWRPKGEKIKLERFAVVKEFRNKGVASAIMENILKDVPADKTLLLHAQIAAMPLYEKFDFKAFGPEFNEAGIRHFAMSLSTSTQTE
ncbi:MAG: GNAT family N-acetyltransferase [Bacteroidia bacterium]|nr:GNAT family N-acetyltransferase [Bacteroidia bacterium]